MVIPCIDLMGGKVVQLVQGRDKALEVDSPFPLLTQFRRFSQLHVIDAPGAVPSTAIVGHSPQLTQSTAMSQGAPGSSIRTHNRPLWQRAGILSAGGGHTALCRELVYACSGDPP